MDSFEETAFRRLLHDVYLKCFRNEIRSPLTEPECKLMAAVIQEKTGLIIGWKSLKNYYNFFLDPNNRSENPSHATLDTLSRYVLVAPASNETDRKLNESHYPWWFKYRGNPETKGGGSARNLYITMGILVVLIFIAIFYFFGSRNRLSVPSVFTENFQSLGITDLRDHGWILKSPEPAFWEKRNERPGYLTLFTLPGDSWPDTIKPVGIKNFLIREITPGCFTSEIHFRDFVPDQNWQQAGILIMEDSIYSGRSIRISLAYNNYFGGFTKPGEIFLQVVTSLGKGYRKPEEIAHSVLFSYDSLLRNEINLNLKNSAFRIEKQGDRFRFLYAGGEMENSAFREVAKLEFEMKPRFIGIFALRGFVENAPDKPVYFNYFNLAEASCE